MKNPLAINVFWNNANSKSSKYAEMIYGFFLRDPDNALDRYLGIPVNLFPHPPEIGKLQLEEVLYSVNILLIDDEMVINPQWESFSNKLMEETLRENTLNHIIIPVGFTFNSFNLSEKISDLNFIRLTDEVGSDRIHLYFLTKVSHAVAQLIYRQPTVSYSGRPIKLFLSHTKRDEEGKELAQHLKQHIDEYYGLDPFFDANDIITGKRFGEVLRENITQSLLIVIQTDEYASSEWCRMELLHAKECNRPLIVINQYEKGEKRSFPYIGNVPHIHFDIKEGSKTEQKIFLDLIILEALREALKIKYLFLITRFKTQDLIDNGFFSNESIISELKDLTERILYFPPELITLVQLKKLKDTFILYPDPPLGEVELALLNELREDLTFITPTMLPLLSNEGKLNASMWGLKVGFSLSETDISNISWIENRRLENVIVELSRYLLISGISLVYSGNINYQNNDKTFNFAELIVKLIKLYRVNYESEEIKLNPLINYSFYPIYELLKSDQEAALKNLVSFIPVSAPEYLGVTPDHAPSIVQYDSFDKRYVWAKSLTRMREEMMMDGNTDYWIILGGKWTGFKGKMSGILEEYLLAKAHNKPIFLLGGFGGVSLGIIQVLQQQECPYLNLEFYQKNYPGYYPFLREFNKHKLTQEAERVDYTEITNKLKAHGQSTDSYGLDNGLTREENDILFETKDEWEIIRLILKGLKTLNSHA